MITKVETAKCGSDITTQDPIISSTTYTYDQAGTPTDLRNALVGASGAVYWLQDISTSVCLITKENTDGTIAWSHIYSAQGVPSKSFAIDPAEAYLYTLETNTPTKDMEIMEHNTTDGAMIQFYK